MKPKWWWNNSDETVFQLMKMNEFLSDIFDELIEIRQELHAANDNLANIPHE